MNKVLPIVGAMAITVASASASFVSKRAVEPMRNADLTAKAELAVKANAASETGIWQPGKITSYDWENGRWVMDEEAVNTYYDDGRIHTTVEQGALLTFIYDSLGRVAEIRGAMATDPNTTVMVYTLTYDPVVENALVKITLSMPAIPGMSVSQGIDVTRDAAGNVVELSEFATNDFGVKEVSELVQISYGLDGKANRIVMTDYDDNIVDYRASLSDIVWENTDGQILDVDIDGFGSALFFGANRIKSCTVTEDDINETVQLAVAYVPDGYHAVATMKGETILDIDYKSVDQYGSYDCTEYEVDFDYDDRTGTLVREDAETEVETYRVDNFGLVLEHTQEYYKEKSAVAYDLESVVGQVTYNAQYGYPEEYISETSDFGGRLTDKDRMVFSDYALYGSGVQQVGDVNSDAVVEYYDLNGVKVANPVNGIYIMRRGSEVVKVAK